LTEITIDNNFSKRKKPSAVDLPFGLLLGDNHETVLNKLGKKPCDKSPTPHGYHCWWTQFDDFRILTALNHDFELIWVRLIKLTLGKKEKIILKKYLTEQNRNIKPENIDLIFALRDSLPTKAWTLLHE
jgi:hypothetical protein